MTTAEPNSTNLLARFVDEGDLLLGRALETKEGRSLFNGIKNYFITGVDPQRIFNSNLHRMTVNKLICGQDLSEHDKRVLILKMMEKAMGDFIQENLARLA